MIFEIIVYMCMQVLQRMLRRSRAKLEHDTERLKMQDGIAHLREASLLRLLKREKTTLHSKQEYVALLIVGKLALVRVWCVQTHRPSFSHPILKCAPTNPHQVAYG